MGATLAETLAEMDAEAQAQTVRQPPPPPPGPATGSVSPAAPPPVKAAPAKAASGGGVMDTVKNVLGLNPQVNAKVYGSINAGLVRAPMQFFGGAVDAAADVGKFVGDNIAHQFVRKSTLDLIDPNRNNPAKVLGNALQKVPAITPLGIIAHGVGDRLATGASLADVLSQRSTIGQVGYPALNQFTTEGIASAVPSLIPGVGEAGLIARTGAAATGGAVGLSADDAKGRAINAGLGAGTEIGVAALGAGGRAILKRVIKPATPAEAAADALDRTFASQRTSAALDKTAEVQQAKAAGKPPEPPEPQEQLPNGTRHTDLDDLEFASEARGKELRADELAWTSSSADKGADHPDTLKLRDQYQTTRDSAIQARDDLANAKVQQSANHLLEQSGAAERVPPEGPFLSPTGKIEVQPETLQALDEAGIDRRAFATKNESPADAVIFKEEATDGSSRVVGSMGKSDLDAFAEEVAHYRENPHDINAPAGGPSGQWTMAHLGAPYDTAAVLRAVVDRLPKQAEGMSNDELMSAARDMADQFGSTPEDAIAFARQITDDDVGHPVVMKGLQTIWKRLGDTVDAHTNSGIDWASADQETADNARQSIHDLLMFSAAFRDAKSSAGRTLGVLQLPDADAYLTAGRMLDNGKIKATPPLQDELDALPKSRADMQTWLDAWGALKDGPEANRMAFLHKLADQAFIPSGQMYLRTSLANFFTGMILSGPKTILLNVLAPGFMGGLRTLERMAGGSVMAINPLASAADRAAGAAMAAHAPIAFVQTLGDVGTAFKYSAATFKASRGMLEGEGHFPLDVNVKGVPDALIKAAQADGKMALPYYMGNILNVLPRFVWRLHGTTNEFALSMGYMGEVRAKAMLEASQLGLKGPEFQAHVLDTLAAATDNATGQATDAASLDSAMRSTMVRHADPEMSPLRASFDTMVQSIRANVPETRYVLPIFQVPANSIGETIRRIPGVGFMLKETRQELSGDLGQFRQADAYGRVLLGAGFLMAGAMMARNEMMTGAGPSDAADRKVWLTTHQPYSFKIGDEWVGYDRMEPVGPLLAIAAGFSDHSVYHDADENSTYAAVGALAAYLKDKAAVQGVADLLNFSGDPQDQASMKNRIGGLAKGFVVPAFVGLARAHKDADLRVKRNPWDYIKDALPVASKTLDPVRNIMGEDVHKAADSLAENLLPITTSPTVIGKDPVLDEIDRLYEKTGYTPGALSPSAGGQAHFDLRDVKIEDGHSIYDALMKARQTTTVDGQTLRATLTDLFNSPEYNDAADGTGKVDDLDGGPKEATRGGMVQKVFTQFSKQAKADVAASSPIARKWMAAAIAKDHANDVLRGTPASDLVKGLSIDLTPYEDKLTEGANQ